MEHSHAHHDAQGKAAGSCCGGHKEEAAKAAPSPAEILESATVPVYGTVKDVVCGMTVTLGKGKPSLKYKGDEFHFCNPKCHDRFEADPYFYLSGNKAKKKTAAAKGTKYTCPMDP
ncbi:MAG: YHS domain-containing protein, partial [Nitratireductor sp.]|nr:YHS domain-containing protein [Nitratireductor sp.]